MCLDKSVQLFCPVFRHLLTVQSIKKLHLQTGLQSTSEKRTSEIWTMLKTEHMLVRLSNVFISGRLVWDFFTKLNHFIYKINFYDPKRPKRSSLANQTNQTPASLSNRPSKIRTISNRSIINRPKYQLVRISDADCIGLILHRTSFE